MSDRTSAEMCGRVITYLHELRAKDLVIKDVWEMMSQADFSPSQAEIDPLRKLYGLDWDEDDEEIWRESHPNED